MKAKVLKKFRDKHTGVIYKLDEVITISKERFAEILETAPLVEKVTEDAEEKPKKPAKKKSK